VPPTIVKPPQAKACGGFCFKMRDARQASAVPRWVRRKRVKTWHGTTPQDRRVCRRFRNAPVFDFSAWFGYTTYDN